MAEYQSLRGRDGDDDNDHPHGRDADWKASMADFGKKVGEQMSVVGGKISEHVSVVGEKMKDLFHTPTLAENLVEQATSDVLIGPDWEKNLHICDLINEGKIQGADVIASVKRRLAVNSGHVRLLCLSFLESALKNCERLFADVASERVLDVMVKLVDDPSSPSFLREKALVMIESWGEATEELRYLPVFEETYKSLKARGIVFPPRSAESLGPIFTPPRQNPIREAYAAEAARAVATEGGTTAADPYSDLELLPAPGVSSTQTPQGRVMVLDSKEIVSVARNSAELLSTVLSSAPAEEVMKGGAQDDLVSNLAAECRAAKRSLQRLVENEADNETLLFEALSINDEIDRVLSKLEEMKNAARAAAGPGEFLPPPLVGHAAVAASERRQIATIPAVAEGEEEDGDGEGGLVRRRTGGAAAAGVGAVPAKDDDEKALDELDAMVFGRKDGLPVSGNPASSTAAASQPQSQGGKEKEEDLIVF